MSASDSRILILGASARAAAESAFRAGLRPICADRFGDEDLVAVAEVLPLNGYPDDLPAAASLAPGIPWMYTGALENRPDIVERISADHPLLGNSPEVLRRIRDPFRVAEVLRDAGLPALELRDTEHPPPPDGSWLRKPRRGSAGRGIRVWDESASRQAHAEEFCFQRRCDGAAMSATYVAAGGRAQFIAATRQLIGRRALHAARFAYCGSIGPVRLPEDVSRQLADIGDQLASRFHLRGLFGVDFLLHGATPWLVEVNPRYTASVEVIEKALDMPLLAWHRRACLEDPAPDQPVSPPIRLSEAWGRPLAKLVWYAPTVWRAPNLADWPRAFALESLGISLHDRPREGTEFRAGEPVLTVQIGCKPDVPHARLRAALRKLRAALDVCRRDEAPSNRAVGLVSS